MFASKPSLFELQDGVALGLKQKKKKTLFKDVSAKNITGVKDENGYRWDCLAHRNI